MGIKSAIARMGIGLANITLRQSEKFSVNLIAHEARKADVEIYKANSIASHQASLQLKSKLAEKLLDAEPEERLRLRQDMQYIDQDIRQLGIYRKAEEYLPSNTISPEERDVETVEENYKQSNEVWLDVFNEYARRSNEPWRADLLSRALALEVQEPGNIGQRALWFIGTVDEAIFHSFAALLDISILLSEEGYLLPDTSGLYESKLTVEGISWDFTVGHATFTLTDLGLIGDSVSHNSLQPQSTIVASYGSRTESFRVINEIRVSGVIYTALAQKIAKLYDPKPTPLGEKVFSEWIEQLKVIGNCNFESPAWSSNL
jgi:hypothetical protein